MGAGASLHVSVVEPIIAVFVGAFVGVYFWVIVGEFGAFIDDIPAINCIDCGCDNCSFGEPQFTCFVCNVFSSLFVAILAISRATYPTPSPVCKYVKVPWFPTSPACFPKGLSYFFVKFFPACCFLCSFLNSVQPGLMTFLKPLAVLRGGFPWECPFFRCSVFSLHYLESRYAVLLLPNVFVSSVQVVQSFP